MMVDSKATDFVAQDQNDKSQKLSDYLGKWVVLYFYPKDDTPGCTTEACSFRDNFHILQQMGVVVLGVSKDSVESHKKFAEKYQLNFPILADSERKIIQSYDITGRTTFLIDPTGAVKKIYEKINPIVHSGQIIDDLRLLTTS